MSEIVVGIAFDINGAAQSVACPTLYAVTGKSGVADGQLCLIVAAPSSAAGINCATISDVINRITAIGIFRYGSIFGKSRAIDRSADSPQGNGTASDITRRFGSRIVLSDIIGEAGTGDSDLDDLKLTGNFSLQLEASCAFAIVRNLYRRHLEL